MGVQQDQESCFFQTFAEKVDLKNDRTIGVKN